MPSRSFRERRLLRQYDPRFACSGEKACDSEAYAAGSTRDQVDAAVAQPGQLGAYRQLHAVVFPFPAVLPPIREDVALLRLRELGQDAPDDVCFLGILRHRQIDVEAGDIRQLFADDTCRPEHGCHPRFESFLSGNLVHSARYDCKADGNRDRELADGLGDLQDTEETVVLVPTSANAAEVDDVERGYLRRPELAEEADVIAGIAKLRYSNGGTGLLQLRPETGSDCGRVCKDQPRGLAFRHWAAGVCGMGRSFPRWNVEPVVGA